MLAFLASAGLFRLMAMGTFPAAAQTLEEAAAACERDDYDTACRMFHRLAEQGDAEARFKPGDMYFRGEGVPLDFAQSAEWYIRAAAQGHPSARSALGLLYECDPRPARAAYARGAVSSSGPR